MENIKTPETTTAHASLPRFSSHLLPQRKATISASLLVVALLASLFVWPLEDLSSGAQAQSEGDETTSTVPSDLVSLHYNCDDYDSESSVTGRIITTRSTELIMYSTREEGDCSLSHSDGDVIVIEEVNSTCRRSTTVYSGTYDCDPLDVTLSSYVMGSHPNAPVGADVYDLDFYVDSTKISGISLPGEVYSSCEYNSSGYSLSFSGRTLAVTSACVLHTDIDYVLSYSNDGQISPLQFRNSRITNKRNELFPGKWWIKLCHRDESPNYSDHCSDIERATQTINFEASKFRDNIHVRWHGITANPAGRTGFPDTIYLRDRHGITELSCRAARAIPGSGYFIFICTGHTQRLDSDFIVLASDATYASRGGTISKREIPTVRVVRMEVTQGLQDWHNSVTLVRGKQTAVRVFVENTKETQIEFTGQLKGTIIGENSRRELGSRVAVNQGFSVIVEKNIVERRHDIRSSLNFILPRNWTDLEEGEVLTLEFIYQHLNEADVQCYEIIYEIVDGKEEIKSTEDRCKETVSFVRVIPPRFEMLPITLTDEEEGEVTTDISLVYEATARIESIMPFPSLIPFSTTNYIDIFDDVEIKPIEPIMRTLDRESTGNTDLDTTLSKLQELRNRSGKEYRSSIFLGLLPGPSRHAFGKGSEGNKVASWFVSSSTEYIYGHTRNTGAHELAHTLGRSHPGLEVVRNGEVYLIGVCGALVPEGSEEYPYYHNFGTDNNENWRATIGPLPHIDNKHDFNDEIWGLDIRYVNPKANENFIEGNMEGMRTEISSEEYDDLSVANPYEVFALMGYCPDFADSSQGRWIGVHNYNAILQQYSVSDDTAEVSGASGNLTKIDSDHFSGSILLSPDGSVENIRLTPVHSRPIRFIPNHASEGEYSLELRNADNIVLLTVPFDVSKNIYDIDPSRIDEIPDKTYADFNLIIGDPPDYSKFAITRSGKDLIVIDRSLNAPVLSVNGPAENQRFTHDDTVTLSWSGNDPDDDELDYTVYYSTDGGSSYKAISLAGNRTSVSFDSLDGSEQARFAVSVSDGTRSTFVETPVFAIDNHAPVVQIISPASSSVFAESQGFLLDGWAYDKEDGFINSSSFSWSSSIDGHLGSESYLVVSAADFTEGNHIITLTVTDSNGATATATTDITISRKNQLPTANDDIIRVVPDDRVLIDVLANDIDIEGDFKRETLAIFDLPVLGTVEITTDQQGNSVVAYSPGTIGTDTFTYLICDGIDRCDIAYVTVTITTDGCTILGTEQDDILRGTSDKDVICGLGGNDTIYGSGGDDIIRAGRGDDTIYGQSGNDLIFGGHGNDNILGHRGNDIIFGGYGNEEIWGGGGDDTIWGGYGIDEIRGEADDDTLYGEDGPDLIHGGRGDDTIYGGSGDDIIRGNQGTDTIYPGLGNNTLLGTGIKDTIIQDYLAEQQSQPL